MQDGGPPGPEAACSNQSSAIRTYFTNDLKRGYKVGVGDITKILYHVFTVA